MLGFFRRNKQTALANRATVLSGGTSLEWSDNPANIMGNPLAGLTPKKAASMVFNGLQGQWTQPQWAMHFIELLDADVFTIVDRRLSGLRELSWTIRTDAKAEERGMLKEAEAQAATLHEAYMGIDNMREAVEHLALAKFRGYAHLAIGDGHLEPLDQWWWVRDGMYGGWMWNPEGKSVPAARLGDAVDETNYVIRVESRSLIWLAIIKFLSANYSKKWWDRFLEISARLGTVVIAPQGVTDEDTFATHASRIAKGDSGWLPNGSEVRKTGPDASRGTKTPWEMRLRYIKEDLVLAGTGGMLTALSQATGMGSGNADEHGDVWRSLLRADARDISEVFQEQLDNRFLDEKHAGKPVLAWFELDTTAKPTPGTVLKHAKTGKEAGYRMSAEELSERTGYTWEMIENAAPAGQVQNRRRAAASALQNRSATEAEAQDLLAAVGDNLGVPESWLVPVAEAFRKFEQDIAGETGLVAEQAARLLEELAESAPELFGSMDIAGLADVLESAMGPAVLEAVRSSISEKEKVTK